MFVITWIIIIAITLNKTGYSQTCTNGIENPRSVRHGASGDDIEWIEIGLNTYTTTLIFDVSSPREFPSENLYFITRLHNDSLPGPTLRMKRGKQYQIRLINNLGPESPNNPTQHNVVKDPNTTNIHTHGLHIGGMRPGDNVYLSLAPGEQHTYIYNIPCDHAGGTFWYHPHHHGSTRNQVAGGAGGVLVIEDDADKEGLPAWYTNMRELIFFILYMNKQNANQAHDATNDYVWKIDKITKGAQGETNLYIINGEYLPTVCMTAGEWVKFKFAHIAPDNPSTYYIGHGDECTVKLLARDGVIVHGLNNTDVPRDVGPYVWLAQPSRADVAIFCQGDVSGDITYEIWTNNSNTGYVAQTIGYLHVIGIATTASYQLTPFIPIRPSYLENLLDGYYSGNLPTQIYPGRQNLPYWNNIVISGTSIGGQSFKNETNYLQRIGINRINTWQIGNPGGFVHPFHVHVNHFQVLNSTIKWHDYGNTPELEQWEPPEGYQVTGDFQDVFFGPGFIRFKTDIWAGTVTMHCHLLRHEDEGAMGTVEITDGCDNNYQPYCPTCTCHYVDTCGQFSTPTPVAITTTTTTTSDPTPTPTDNPTPSPTNNPTPSPTDNPTPSPTDNPTPAPTDNPTLRPTDAPYTPGSPTSAPTEITDNPTKSPTEIPTKLPTNIPTLLPTNQPTIFGETLYPTTDPSSYPSDTPTDNPISLKPTISPIITSTIPTYSWSICEDENKWRECNYKLQIFMDIIYEWLSIVDMDLDNIIIPIFKKYILFQFSTKYNILPDNIGIDLIITEDIKENTNADDDTMSSSRVNVTMLIGTDNYDTYNDILSIDILNNNLYNNMYDLIENDVLEIYTNSAFNIITSIIKKTESLSGGTTTSAPQVTENEDNSTFWIILGVVIGVFVILGAILLYYIIGVLGMWCGKKKQYQSSTPAAIHDGTATNIGLTTVNTTTATNYIVPDPSPLPTSIKKTEDEETPKNDETDNLNTSLQQEQEDHNNEKQQIQPVDDDENDDEYEYYYEEQQYLQE